MAYVERYGRRVTNKTRTDPTGSPQRDTQRQKLYRAEEVLRRDGAPGAERFGSVTEMQAFVDKLVTYAWWKRAFPYDRHITVKDGRGRRSACGDPVFREISMPTWSRTKAVLLHEVAHVVAPRDVAWHGWEFAEVYLKLVQHCLGADEAKALKASFKQHHVRYTKPRAKRELTHQERALLRTRMNDLRARGVLAAKTGDR